MNGCARRSPRRDKVKRVGSAWGWLALLLCAFVPNAAHAQTALHYRREPGAESCLSREQLVHAVRARTGVALQSEGAAAARLLSAGVEATAPGYRVLIKLHAPDGRLLGARELADNAEDCTALGDALVLTIALMVGPARSAPAPTPATPEATSPWQLRVRAGAAASAGLLPRARAHAALGLWLGLHERFALELAAAAFGSVEERAQQTNRSVRFTPAWGTLSGCLGLVRAARLAFDTCLGAQLGVILARASGFTGANYQRSGFLLAPVLRAPLRLSLGARIELVTVAMIGVSLSRPRFQVRDREAVTSELGQPARLFAALELGLGFEL